MCRRLSVTPQHLSDRWGLEAVSATWADAIHDWLIQADFEIRVNEMCLYNIKFEHRKHILYSKSYILYPNPYTAKLFFQPL